MTTDARTKVLTNYYRASEALLEIGTMADLPEELRQLAAEAYAATMKIMKKVNASKAA